MKYLGKKLGFTLLEALVVVAITVVLIGLVIGVAGRIDTQNKERLLGGIFAELNVALQEFADYGYEYEIRPGASQDEIDFYNSLDYPLDCNEFSVGLIINQLIYALGVDVVIDAYTYEGHEEYSGSEVMYFFLNQVPSSREILNRINTRFLTSKDKNGQLMVIKVGVSTYRSFPLIRVLDPWGKPLRYEYYMDQKDYALTFNDNNINNYYAFASENKKVFPVLSSAGPDGEWNTGDDIKSR